MTLEELRNELDSLNISEKDIEELKKRMEKASKSFEVDTLSKSFKEFLERNYRI